MVGAGEAALLFGGVRSRAPNSWEYLQDSWTWDGKHWRQRQDLGPAPRAAHALGWDAARNRGVLFGGSVLESNYKTTYFGDTWESFEGP
jgi:hypothetical protein